MGAPPGRAGRRRRRAMSLERKLPLLFAVQVAAVLLVSLALTYGVLSRSAEHDVADHLDNAVRELARSVETTRARRAERMQQLSEDADLRALLHAADSAAVADRPLRQKLASLLLTPDSELPVEVWTADGRRVAHVGVPSTPETRPPAPLGEIGSVHGTPFIEHQGTVLAWTVAPVRDDGRLLGYIAVQSRIEPSPDVETTLRQLIGVDVALSFRNDDGSLWARNGKRIRAPRASVSSDSVLELVHARGRRTVAAQATVAATPYVIVLESPHGVAAARARATVVPLALASLALLVLGAVISWLLSRRLTRPLAAVSRAAQDITAGNYGRRVDVDRADEIGHLAASFNHMAAEIQTSHDELTRRIDEAEASRRDADRLRGEAEEAREMAEHASRAKSDFLAVMSHELRTPLNAIGGYAQLIELGVHGAINDRQRDALHRIERNQKHLLHLINDVLSYASLAAVGTQYHVADIPVDEVFADLEVLIGDEIRARAVNLVCESAPGLVVRADRDKLQQILLNLLSNAAKFTAPEGTITVDASESAAGDSVYINVRDTGSGIAADRIPLIFDPFFQEGRALNNPGEGVGLGLSISRDLAIGMDGDLSVRSKVGVGSVFTLRLPAGVREHAERAASA